jgi:DNA-binding NtrC family response regulator
MKLLRVLQHRVIQKVGSAQDVPVDVRLIAATHRQLESEVSAGRFRPDLFYRLNVIAISLPPLRERQEDIPLLAKYFEFKYAQAFNRPQTQLSAEAISYLTRCAWPGNVRQLENAIERAIALAGDSSIGPEAFCDAPEDGSDSSFSSIFRFRMRQACQQFERQYLLDSLRRFDGNVTKAASYAGLPRQNFHRKMKQLGISAVRSRRGAAKLVEPV